MISILNACLPENTNSNRTKSKVTLDSLGIIASFICLLHCIFVPLILFTIPVFAVRFLEADSTHKMLAFFVVLFATLSVIPGYFRHKNLYVLSGMISGLLFVLFATFASGKYIDATWELPLISAGNFIIIATHFWNNKLCNRSLDCCKLHENRKWRR